MILLSGCAQEQLPPAKTAETRIVGSQISINAFKFIYESWSPGNSGLIRSKIVTFPINGKNIALVNREGYKGRNVVQGTSGETIIDGAAIRYGNGKYGVDFKTIIPTECALEYGDGQFCEVFMSGKCLLSCKSEQIIEILNSDKLNACLNSDNGIIPQILDKEVQIHNLVMTSPCVFNNGEYLRLKE
jgi:hypothetical protein